MSKELADDARELRFKSMEVKLLERQRSMPVTPSKLLAPTKASEGHRLTVEELDEMEHRRVAGPAHTARVAGGGYDLKFCGKAVPAWVRPEVR